MYVLLRLIICLLLCFVLYRRLFNNRKKMLCILMIVIFNLSYYLPIENAFVSFENVNQLYSYMLKEQPLLTIEGKDSTLVIEKDRGTVSSRILNKNINGYKISIFNAAEESEYFYSDCFVRIIKSEKDIYINVYSFDRFSSINDNLFSQFYEYELGVSDNKQYVYCAYLSDYDDKYQLFINGVLFTFDQSNKLSD